MRAKHFCFFLIETITSRSQQLRFTSTLSEFLLGSGRENVLAAENIIKEKRSEACSVHRIN